MCEYICVKGILSKRCVKLCTFLVELYNKELKRVVPKMQYRGVLQRQSIAIGAFT